MGVGGEIFAEGRLSWVYVKPPFFVFEIPSQADLTSIFLIYCRSNTDLSSCSHDLKDVLES